MPHRKGHTNNPNGRPKGSSNVDKEKLRKFVSHFLESKFEQVLSDYEELEARDRLKVYCELLQYGLPKLASISAEINANVSVNWTEQKTYEVKHQTNGSTGLLTGQDH